MGRAADRILMVQLLVIGGGVRDVCRRTEGPPGAANVTAAGIPATVRMMVMMGMNVVMKMGNMRNPEYVKEGLFDASSRYAETLAASLTTCVLIETLLRHYGRPHETAFPLRIGGTIYRFG